MEGEALIVAPTPSLCHEATSSDVGALRGQAIDDDKLLVVTPTPSSDHEATTSNVLPPLLLMPRVYLLLLLIQAIFQN